MEAPPREPYLTDVTDEEWAFVTPYLTLITEDARNVATPSVRSSTPRAQSITGSRRWIRYMNSSGDKRVDYPDNKGA